MKILTIIKRVPDTAANIKILEDGSGIDKTNLNYVTNPYDEYALETALRLKEAKGAELEVLAVSDNQDILRNALAVGADRAYMVEYADYDRLDPYNLSRIYAEVIKQKGPYDIILTGKVTIDDNSYAVGGYLAAFLGLNYVSHIVAAEFEGDELVIEKETDRGSETLAVSLPAILTHERGKYEPRLPNLRGIMQAKRKPLDILKLDDLGITITPAYEIIKLTPPPKKEGGRILESVDELIEVLKNEIKVI